MSPQTPPHHSQRDDDHNKENNALLTPTSPAPTPMTPSSRITWSRTNQVHSLAVSPKRPTTLSASRCPPKKSILKKCSLQLLSLPQLEKQREITPEPADPLVNLTYLEYPVNKVIPEDAPLSDAIEGYNVLLARLRASVNGMTDVDASWPLFQPLRKNKEAFVRSLVRDLGRALVDPGKPAGEHNEETREKQKALASLPSPKQTPKKKRDGMSAEQVKYARDLCTTCHSAIRCLSLILALPALRNLFDIADLRKILNALLAVLLAPDLPTPNARKTWALAMWLVQVQRLPEDVLAPAASRIAAVIGRGIDGELGKEGKKGAVSDGLKAIHDLSIYKPSIFIPAFTNILPSILANLLAPTLALRLQACQALGGFVIGYLSLPILPEDQHRISNIVSDFILAVSPQPDFPLAPSPMKGKQDSPRRVTPSSPSKLRESQIVRTLRTILPANDGITHAAQGPVWGLCVLASLIVLLRTALITDERTTRVVCAMLGLGMRHKRSAVRAVGCLVWRCLIWVWFQPDEVEELYLEERAAAAGEDGESRAWKEEERRKRREVKIRLRRTVWDAIEKVPELNTGATMITALLSPAYDRVAQEDVEQDADGDEPWADAAARMEERRVDKVLRILEAMFARGGRMGVEGSYVLRHLVSFTVSGANTEEWQVESIIPKALFSSQYAEIIHSSFSSSSSSDVANSNAGPGLLHIDYPSLAEAVRPIYDEIPGIPDVPTLKRDDIIVRDDEKKNWVWNRLIALWREGLDVLGGELSIEKDREESALRYVRSALVTIWEGLVGENVAYFQESGDDESTTAFAIRAADLLIHILGDDHLDLSAVLIDNLGDSDSGLKSKKSQVASSDQPRSPQRGTIDLTASCIAKLDVVSQYWDVLQKLVPRGLVGPAAERMLACLMKNEAELTGASVLALKAQYSQFLGSSRGSQMEDEEEYQGDEALSSWVDFCVDVLLSCDVEALKAFWGYRCTDGHREWEWTWAESKRRAVWKRFVERWSRECTNAADWESWIVLLSIPFMDGNAWQLNDEDFGTWKTCLELTISQALDYGVAGYTVLDRLARSLLRHNHNRATKLTSLPIHVPYAICPSVTLMTFVEVLLSYLYTYIGDMHDVPMAVVEFVSESMKLVYPPVRGEDRTIYMWVVRALTSVVRDCDIDFMSDIFGCASFKEAVSMWIADIWSAWSVKEIEHDIMDLYPFLLMRITELPIATETIDNLVSIIEAPFVGRDDTAKLAADAFRDFWETTYGALDKPLYPGGWPASIRTCLKAAGLAVDEKEASFVEASQEEEQELILPPSSPPDTPRTPTKRLPPTQPCTPVSTNAGLSSSKGYSVHLSTPPPRPHKASASSFTSYSLQASPGSPGSEPRTPIRVRSQKQASPQRSPKSPSSPNKRRKLDNKENESPSQVHVRTLADRICDSNEGEKPSVLGKRQLHDEVLATCQTPVKKGKTIACSSPTDSDSEREDVEVSLIVKDEGRKMSPKAKSTADAIAGEKRQRVIMDAVVVPNLREVYRRLRYSASFDTLAEKMKSPVYAKLMATASGGMCRRTKSLGKTNSEPLLMESRKRRRSSDEDEDDRAFFEQPPSDSFTLARPASSSTSSKTLASQLPSSDDDPHIGQVTPRHLISPNPAGRRSASASYPHSYLGKRRDLDNVDPPSDDSVIGSSPSKAIVERKMKRMGSFGSVKPQKLQPLSFSSSFTR